MQGRGEYRSLAPTSRTEAPPELQDLRGIAGLDRAHQTHLFDRISWIEALHRFCMPNMEPHILHASEGPAEGWLFLADTGNHSRTAIANYYSFAFRPIFSGDPSADQRLRLVETMARDLALDTAQIDMFPIMADDGSSELILSAFRKAGWIAVRRIMGTNHFLVVEGRDFARYWAGRPGALRNTVRRKQRASTLAFEVHDTLTDALWDDYVAVYRNSWKPSEPNLDFLRAIAAQESEAGALRLGFARNGAAPVATQLWTVENGVALIHKLAHHQSADDASPGTLLSHFMFRHVIDTDRVEQIDYGTGDNPYKTEWMEAQRPLYRIDCFNPRFSSAWLPAARTAISMLVG